AAQGVRGTEHGGVAVHHLEVLDGSLAQRIALDVLLLVRGRTGAELIPARADAAGEVRDHAAAVVDEQLQAGVAFEYAGEDDPGHERGQVVLPAERPPDLVPGPWLGGVVRPGGAAARVDLKNLVELGHPCVERLE